MTIDQIINNIESNFIALSNNCKNEFKKVSKTLTLAKETVIVKEGDFADKTYFIAEGCAMAFYIKDGKDITDWFAFENDFISSINSFFLNIPSPHYIEVLEKSTLLQISRANINLLSKEYPEFDQLTKLVITKTMLQQQQRIASMQFETAQMKYENLLKIRPNITQRVALKHIASYIGITLETLSRIRNPKNRI